MVDLDDLPDEGGPAGAAGPAAGRMTGRGDSGQNVPKSSVTDDLPDEGGSIAGASEREMAQDGGHDVGDYSDKILVEGDDPTEEQLAGADYYVTLEGVEKELERVADALEIGAWEGQDVELRTLIKSLEAIRHTLNGAINR